MVAVSRGGFKARVLLPAQPLLAHQTRDAVTTMTLPSIGQFPADARATIRSIIFLINRGDLRAQRGIGQRARTWRGLALGPIVVPAARHSEGFTKDLDRVLVFHFINPLVTLFGGSERMPKVFFRMSRCWRSCSFSRRNAASSAATSAGVPGLGMA